MEILACVLISDYGVDWPVLEPYNSLVLECKCDGFSDGFFFIKIYNSLPGFFFFFLS